MKTHLRKGRCPNLNGEKQENIWGNIKEKNEGMERTKQGGRKGGKRNETFIERETHYGRIKKDWDGIWMCTRCPYKRKNENSLRNHLAMAHK